MYCFTNKTNWHDFCIKNFGDIRAPFIAGIELWPHCNFKCIHCYAESERTKSCNSLSTEKFKEIIDILVEHSCIELFFTGGEALLYPDFKEIYVYAKEKGLIVSVLTNGSLINEEIIELWLEYPPDIVSMTMYGASAETYEKVTRNYKGYEMFIKGVELLEKAQIPFEIKCIGMKQNINDVLKIREYGRRKGLKNSMLSFYIRPMNDGNREPLGFRVEPHEAFAIELEDPELRAYWENLASSKERITKTRRQEQGMQYPCAIAKQFVFITHDGFMQGCVKEVNVRYNLLQGNFDEGWEFLGKELYEKKAKDDFKCLKCDKFKYCAECTADNINENGNPSKPVKFNCDLAELRRLFMDEIVTKGK